MNVAASLTETLDDLRSNGLLGPSDAAIVALLHELAELIDQGDVTAAMVREYRLALSELTQRQRTTNEAMDELLRLLRDGS